MTKVFISALLLIGFLGGGVYAQPTGKEPRQLRALLEPLQQRIEEISKEIRRHPRQSTNYRLRAQLYTELHKLLYQSYLGEFYRGEKPEHLYESSIAARAIADYSVAIKASPASAELYRLRGNMYWNRWYAEPGINWYERVKGFKGTEWHEFLNWDDPEHERQAFGEFVTDPLFAGAVNDYTAALKLDMQPGARKEIRTRLGRLYLTRVHRLPFYMRAIRDFAVGTNPFSYSAWKDLDVSISHYEAILAIPTDNSVGEVTIEDARKAIRETYHAKARLALDLGQYDIALESLNAGEKYLEIKPVIDHFACKYLSDRARVYVKLKNFDAAIAEATRLVEKDDNQLCDTAYEPRADGYLAKGDLRAAIADYDKVAKFPYSNSDASYYIYRNRAIANLKLGDPEKALKDMSIFFNYGGSERRTVDDYALYAEAYRKAGKEDMALTMEHQTRDAKLSLESMARSRDLHMVFGKVLLPDGTPIQPSENSRIMLIQEGRKHPLEYTPSFDEKGRFLFYDVEKKPFILYASVENNKGGKPGRFFFRSRSIIPKDRFTGPIVIKLEEFARK